MNLLDHIRQRHSCRSYREEPVAREHIESLLEAARLAPSACNQQPWRFAIVTDNALRQRLVNEGFLPGIRMQWALMAPVHIVLGIKRGVVTHRIAPLFSRVDYPLIDAGIAGEHLVLAATELGLGTCWIGPGADQKSIIEHLGDRFDPEKDHVICVCAIGYESMYKPLLIRVAKVLQHVRLPLSELFFSDPSCKVALETDSAPFNEHDRCYEVCQWSPSSYNSQTTRCAAVTSRVGGQDKLIRFDFCVATTSRYYAAVALGIWCANWETGCAALNKCGHFAVLSSKERATVVVPELPRYDVSWIID